MQYLDTTIYWYSANPYYLRMYTDRCFGAVYRCTVVLHLCSYFLWYFMILFLHEHVLNGTCH